MVVQAATLSKDPTFHLPNIKIFYLFESLSLKAIIRLFVFKCYTWLESFHYPKMLMLQIIYEKTVIFKSPERACVASTCNL
jgi:hypothetical protein